MKYSIVIPTYNHCDDLLKPCIESILKNSHCDQIELIVSANGCRDNTKYYLDNLRDQYTYLGLSENFKYVWSDAPLGYARAVNAGIKVSSTDYILLLNNDVIILDYWLKNTWIENLASPLIHEPTVGVTCTLTKYSPVTQRDFAIFFCAMISRNVLNHVGLLSEDYIVGGHEDTDYCMRVELAGYSVRNVDANLRWSSELNMNVGTFPIYHAGEGTVHDPTLVKDWEETFRRNELILAKKYNIEWYEKNRGSYEV